MRIAKVHINFLIINFLFFTCLSFTSDIIYYIHNNKDDIRASLLLSLDNQRSEDCHGGTRVSQAYHYSNQSLYTYHYLSVADFQQIFQATLNEHDILNNYQLYAFPNFCAYARTLLSYEDFMIALQQKIEHDKTFRKQTAYIPGFEYSFGLRSEKSGFHNFVRSEVQNILTTKNRKDKFDCKTGLVVTTDNLKELLNSSTAILKSNRNNSAFNNRIAARIKAIKNMHHGAQFFDYSSEAFSFGASDLYAKEFNTLYGTHLDCQLHKELYESRKAMMDLEYQFSYSPHVQAIAPAVHYYAAKAKVEKDPITAFQLSDFCYAVTQLCAQGMKILCEASSAVGKGAWKGINEFASIERWKDMAKGALQLGLLFITELGKEDALHYAMVFSAVSPEHSDYFMKAAEQYSLQEKARHDAISQCAQETYKKIKAMSWQEILEQGTEIGTTIILDTVALNALNGFSKVAGRSLVKNLSSAAETGVLFTEQYAVEVAGFGKLIVEEGVETSATIAANAFKNDLSLFAKSNKNTLFIESNLRSVAGNIHKDFTQLIQSAKTTINGSNTAAGRAFQKHAIRQGSAFVGEITGNAVKNTDQAMNYINQIIKSSESTFVVRNTKSYGEVLDIRLPDGMGARWTSDGKKFIGFLERYSMQTIGK